MILRKDKIRLDIFQDSLSEGDMLVDSAGEKYKFFELGYCQWLDSCNRCRGKMLVKHINGFKDWQCFGSSYREEQWSTLWHDRDQWIDDKDFLL